jgi:tetratricopeptide (TPR) repeat protein
MTVLTAARRRRKWLFGLAAMLLIGGAALGVCLWPRPRPPEPPEVPLKDLDPEVADAVRSARAEVVKDPQKGAAWGLLGRVLLANEIYPDRGLTCFLEAERLDPENPRWPYFAADELLNLYRTGEAVPKLERAVELCGQTDQAPAAPRLLLAETLVTLGRSEAAEGHLHQALAESPGDVRAHYDLGMLAFTRGQWALCRSHLEACLGSRQAGKKACAQLAAVCQRQGDTPSADKYAALAERLPKDLGWSDPFVAEHADLAKRKRDRYRVVEQLEAEGHFDRAASLVARLVKDYPDDYLPSMTMGKIIAQMGQFEAAQQYLFRARELAPDKVQVHYLLGLTLFERGETLWAMGGDKEQARALFKESVQATRQALALKSDYGFAHMVLGLALRHLGRPKESLAAFREAVHCNPEYTDIHYFLAMALLDTGQRDEARQHLEEARLLAGPNDSRAADALKQFFPKGGGKSKG